MANKEKMYLRFLHPTQCGRNESVYVDTALEDLEEYIMPTEETNGIRRSSANVKLGKLVKEGYIKDDKILVRLEVLP